MSLTEAELQKAVDAVFSSYDADKSGLWNPNKLPISSIMP